MANIDFSKRDSFGSKFGVIAAAAGSAIGLGNIWRFPYVAGENGGAAFLLVYLFFILVIGLPVMLSEFTIGRRARLNPFGAFKKLSPGKPWYLVGFMGVVAAFVILAFYGTVAGWTLEYIANALTNSFEGKSATQLETMFSDFKDSTFRPIMWQLIFMVLTAFIVLAGVKNGIEKYTKILMPILLVLIIVLCIRSVTLPGASKGLEFLFNPDFSKLNANSILEALGQAFFSLSIGMGTLITYGSYIPKSNNLSNTALQVSLADTLIAILAGIAIFPAVFAFDIAPGSGPGLVYITLPNIFQQMPGGSIFAVMFFLLLTVAALTSSISVLEVVVAYFSEELKIKRKSATWLATGLITAIGVLCTMSWGVLKDVSFTFSATETDMATGGEKMYIFDILDFAASNVFLPLGGLFIVLFVGWAMHRKNVHNEISNAGKFRTILLPIFMFIVKIIAPIAIALVFLNGIGLLNF